MKILAVILTILMASGCSSSSDATKALEEAGYTEIQTHGYSFFACSKDDAFATAFTAKGPTGKPTRGTVCSGWFKGKTIRMD